MATHRLEIHHSMLPDTSGYVYWASGNAGGGFDRYPHEMLLYADDATTDRWAAGAFQVPQNFNSSGTTKFIIRWAATVISLDVVWDLAYKCVSASESLDPTTDDDASDTVTTTASGTARTCNESSMTVTSSDFAAGDTVLFKLTRNMANASDTLGSTAYVESVIFEYTD